MSLFAQFTIPAETFALSQTLSELPEMKIEIERVVATDDLLTPYFWAECNDPEQFEKASMHDSSVANLKRLDEFETATLFRAEWTENIEAIVYAYTRVGATILEASGQYNEWILRMRFDEHQDLKQFQEYCQDMSIPFSLSQLHELSQPRTGVQFGLTTKQTEALKMAYEMSYFTSGEVHLEDVASELSITPQSLSERLHRGYHSLIEHSLMI